MIDHRHESQDDGSANAEPDIAASPLDAGDIARAEGGGDGGQVLDRDEPPAVGENRVLGQHEREPHDRAVPDARRTRAAAQLR